MRYNDPKVREAAVRAVEARAMRADFIFGKAWTEVTTRGPDVRLSIQVVRADRLFEYHDSLPIMYANEPAVDNLVRSVIRNLVNVLYVA